jgi:hypothetical protein
MGRGADAHRQRGAALLLLLALSGVLAVVVVLNLLSAGAPSAQERERVTQEALGRAKQALIAYVVSELDRNPSLAPGLLPCPALTSLSVDNDEGYAVLGDCGIQDESQVGRLPWKTLDVEPLRDGYGECLWYAVSGNFKRGNTAGGKLVNWDTTGQLEVLGEGGSGLLAGATAETRAAAVVIAPGPSLQQSRAPAAHTPNCPGNHDPAQYLEAISSLGADNTLATPPSTPPAGTLSGGLSRLINGYTDPATGRSLVNDRLIVVTPKEIFDAIEKRRALVGPPEPVGTEPTTLLRRLTKRVAQCLAEFPYDRLPDESVRKDRRLPWAAGLAPANYALDVSYAEVNELPTGRVPAYLGVSAALPPAPPPTYVALDPRYLELHCSHWPEIRHWFQHWKDHLFYAVSADFDQRSGSPSDTLCAGSCLTVDGQPTPYPAVVMFAGRPLPGQRRTLSSERNAPGNYLEGRNLLRALDPASGRDHESASASASFNDVLYCIRFTSGTMWNDANGNKEVDAGEEAPSTRIPRVDLCLPP